MISLIALVLLAGPAPDAGVAAAPLPQLLTQACASCHSLMLIEQQRLTAAQWAGTIAKMRGWGALLDDAQAAALAEQLAVTQGPVTPLPDLARSDAKALVAAPEPLKPSLPRGDVKRGQTLFAGRCLACHGPDARGLIGVNLVRRPILDRDAELATFVRKGRGLMVPNPDLNNQQLGDLIAYLKTLPEGAAR